MSTLLDRRVDRAPLRVVELGDADRGELTALVDRDPFVNVVVASRLDLPGGLSPRRFGGQLLGVRDQQGRLSAAAFNGGNLLPIGGGPDEWQALAEHLAGTPRVCTSVVGRNDAVAAFWEVLEPSWGSARAVRERQPMLLADRAVATRPAHVGLRAVRADELDVYLPAAAAMFTEELGVSPQDGSSGAYRSRISRLIRAGRAFAVIDAGTVQFKADFGAVSTRTCQIQGVWTHPDLRRTGLATAAMVGVLDQALRAAPTASLYVNDYNEPARRLYARLGLREIAVLSTVLY